MQQEEVLLLVNFYTTKMESIYEEQDKQKLYLSYIQKVFRVLTIIMRDLKTAKPNFYQ